MAGGNLTAGDVGKVDIGSDPETTKQTTNISERSKVVSLEEWYDREFLPLYPLPHRDDQRGDALAELRKLGPDRREQIVEGLKRWSVSPKFSKDGGEFAPGPGTFLKDRFFERTPAAATNGKARAERPTLDELYGEKA